ncbi:hypothetical protein ACE15N_12320 [Xanthomonas campestris pv. passiflorae]|uniref:hypothetical protein n=1 Tax=Xanthomonas campestris TaxID=339 RepID=UPI0024279298|nr:hypothetical protein [Xanthomonas campestris]MBV6815631.1 hypothetical protein [Xanthomonas campestris pv. passiflorae]
MKEANVPMEEGNIWRRKRPAHFDRTFGLLPSTAWPAHGIAAPPCIAQSGACPALHRPALPCLALPCFAYAFPGPHTAAARPADTTRRAARMDARRFCKGHGCPLQKFLPDLRTRSAEGAQGARTGCAFFLVIFSLHKQRKSNSRPKGVKALLSAQLSRTIPKKRERSALNLPPKKNAQALITPRFNIAQRRTLIRSSGTFSPIKEDNVPAGEGKNLGSRRN